MSEWASSLRRQPRSDGAALRQRETERTDEHVVPVQHDPFLDDLGHVGLEYVAVPLRVPDHVRPAQIVDPRRAARSGWSMEQHRPEESAAQERAHREDEVGLLRQRRFRSGDDTEGRHLKKQAGRHRSPAALSSNQRWLLLRPRLKPAMGVKAL